MDRYDYRRGYNRKRRNRRRTRNRIIIVTTGVILVLIAALLLTALFKALFKPHTATADTAVVQDESVEATEGAAQNLLSVSTFIKPNIEDDGSDAIDAGSIYVWNKKAFELFFGGESQATRYAELMNKAGAELGEGINVYSMVVPNHTEFGLPERLKDPEKGGAQTEDQAAYLKYAYEHMDNTVIPVNPYNKLSEHCNEYIYFNSDHHWSGLGAYYSYTAFAETAGLPVLNLADCTENTIEGFTGTLMKMTSAEVETDTVHYWTFPYTVTDTIHDEWGGVNEYDSCYYAFSEAGDNTYGVFLMGDNPLEVITSSSENTNGEKIAVIHESYGNAFVPYLTYNYDEVYSIDFRSWTGDLSDFCAENGITNVIFVNGVMSSATQVQLDSIEALL